MSGPPLSDEDMAYLAWFGSLSPEDQQREAAMVNAHDDGDDDA